MFHFIHSNIYFMETVKRNEIPVCPEMGVIPDPLSLESAAIFTDEALTPGEPGIITSDDLIPSPDEVLDYKIKKLSIAILSEEGFEEVELTSPMEALKDAGLKVELIAPHGATIRGWNAHNWGKEVKVDKSLKFTNVEDYDAVVLPGGVMNSDKLRQNKDAVYFISECIRQGKTIAAICHGGQLLIETGMISGTTMTSYPSLQTDFRNAGVNWVDEEMVHYGQFITSRKPADLDAFNRELIRTLL